MIAVKHCHSMILGAMCYSFEHISDHYVMVEARYHCSVDCTSILYV